MGTTTIKLSKNAQKSQFFPLAKSLFPFTVSRIKYIDICSQRPNGIMTAHMMKLLSIHIHVTLLHSCSKL